MVPIDDEDQVRYLAKCLHRSSVVVHAVCGHIRSPATNDVVFAKETALELVVLAHDGIVQSVCEQPVFGTIKDMKLLPWNESYRAPQLQTYGKDLVVLLSDSGKLSFLTFSVEFHRFLAVSQIHISHPGGSSLRELGWLLAAESRGRAVAVAAFEDQVAIFPASLAAGNNVVDKEIKYPSELAASSDAEVFGTPTWGTVWSMTFVSSSTDGSGSKQGPPCTLAVLIHRRGALSNEVQLLAYEPEGKRLKLTARFDPSATSMGSRLTFSLLEVPGFPGYILLLRVGDITLVDISSISDDMVPSAVLELADLPYFRHTGEEGAGKERPSVCSFSWEPDSSIDARLAFSVNSGGVFIARFRTSASGKPGVLLTGNHHRCSACKVVLWTKDGFIAAMVEMGDGQVLEVEAGLACQGTIQNIAPVIDCSLVDYYGEKQNQMVACCGVGQEGSVRVIRNGNKMEKLMSTPPVYDGVSAIWTMRIAFADPYHAFFVISFVEQTRVLSVGLNFADITDAVGFEAMESTVACGLVEDNWVAQVYSGGVRLCCPTKTAHPSGADQPTPTWTSWTPQECTVSLGAVSRAKVVVALSQPGLIILLGTSKCTEGRLELMELQHCTLGAEVSCISIPEEENPSWIPVPPTIAGLLADDALPAGVEAGKVCLVGTHKPSVEVLSILPGENFVPLAVGRISLVNSDGSEVSGCVPQDVRLALFDQLHLLTGLRNGMLLRYEWLDSSDHPPEALASRCSKGRPAELHLIAVRRLGVSPIFLVPLKSSLRSDIVALSDRPWLLRTARHNQRIAYSSISFQPSTHATPVCSQDCPSGIFFVSDNSLHLVEMEQSKKSVNIQKLHLGATARRVVYHNQSKTLLLLQTEAPHNSGVLSRLSCIDPLSGVALCSHAFGVGEIAKSMHLKKAGNDELVLVGTAWSSQRPLLPSGEPESSKGRLFVIHLEPKTGEAIQKQNPDAMITEDQAWQMTPKSILSLPGAVLAVASFHGYVLAAAGNSLYCLGSPRLKKISSVKTRFLITHITVNVATIAVGDCRDGIIFYTFNELDRKFESIEFDPIRRLVADCVLLDARTAVVTDRCGNFSSLTSRNAGEGDLASPENNLTMNCWFHMGEVSMCLSKGSFAYEDPSEEAVSASTCTVIAATLLGSVFMFLPVTKDEYELLQSVESKLAVYPLTAPVLGNEHARFRRQGCPMGNVKVVLDGDMLAQFLELTSSQQVAVLNEQEPIEQVLSSLERIHHALT